MIKLQSDGVLYAVFDTYNNYTPSANSKIVREPVEQGFSSANYSIIEPRKWSVEFPVSSNSTRTDFNRSFGVNHTQSTKGGLEAARTGRVVFRSISIGPDTIKSVMLESYTYSITNKKIVMFKLVFAEFLEVTIATSSIAVTPVKGNPTDTEDAKDLDFMCSRVAPNNTRSCKDGKYIGDD